MTTDTPTVDAVEYRARRLAVAGGPAAPELRHVLALLDEARRLLDAVEAAGLERQRQTFLGGLA